MVHGLSIACEGRSKYVPSDASVRGHNKNWGQVTLQGPVQEGKALHVQHMDLVDK